MGWNDDEIVIRNTYDEDEWYNTCRFMEALASHLATKDTHFFYRDANRDAFVFRRFTPQ